jgi:hypothetical protein
MRIPRLELADCIKHNTCEVEINGKWYIAKPLGLNAIAFFRRLRIAFGVFVGKYDAVKYKEDNR